MSTFDDRHMQKYQAIKAAEERWDVVRGLVGLAWVAGAVGALALLTLLGASATSYAWAVAAWFATRWVLLRALAARYVARPIAEIEREYPRREMGGEP